MLLARNWWIRGTGQCISQRRVPVLWWVYPGFLTRSR
jgi:hypothetical protein